jgi:hypothetical protein
MEGFFIYSRTLNQGLNGFMQGVVRQVGEASGSLSGPGVFYPNFTPNKKMEHCEAITTIRFH